MSLSNLSGEGRGRAVDAEINMVPMIDLLVCTITFLILSAVWSAWSRLPATAAAPGQSTCGGCASKLSPSVHVTVEEERFSVAWKQGNAVERSYVVPRAKVMIGAGASYPALAEALARDAAASPEPTSPTRAVIHTDGRTRFAEIAATLDAVARAKRGGQPAYDATFGVE